MRNLFTVICILFVFSFAKAVPTELSSSEISETDAAVSLSAADQANGNKVYNPNGDIFFLIKSNAGSSTVTFTPIATSLNLPGYGAVTKSALTVTVSNGTQRVVGPFQAGPWNDSSGYLQLSYSAVGTTSVVLTPYYLRRSLR